MIQIAGVSDREEAALLLAEGVEWLGFPLRLPVHREDLPEDDAARIIRSLPPPARGVLITYLARADELLAFCRQLGAQALQLHGELTRAEAQALRKAAPDLFLIKSLVVRANNRDELRRTARDFAPFVDAFITDTYDPSTGASGATGKTHDWSVSRELVGISPRPVILAGGLSPENVRRAILEVRPAGVDAHTGVEDANGRKDRERVRKFMAEARAGFAALRSQTP